MPDTTTPDASAPATEPTGVTAPPMTLYLFCPVDDTYWLRVDDTRCWCCGQPGKPAHHPALTSQHGTDYGEHRLAPTG